MKWIVLTQVPGSPASSRTEYDDYPADQGSPIGDLLRIDSVTAVSMTIAGSQVSYFRVDP